MDRVSFIECVSLLGLMDRWLNHKTIGHSDETDYIESLIRAKTLPVYQKSIFSIGERDGISDITMEQVDLDELIETLATSLGEDESTPPWDAYRGPLVGDLADALKLKYGTMFIQIISEYFVPCRAVLNVESHFSNGEILNDFTGLDLKKWKMFKESINKENRQQENEDTLKNELEKLRQQAAEGQERAYGDYTSFFETFPVIRKIFLLFSEGKDRFAISDELTDDGTLTRLQVGGLLKQSLEPQTDNAMKQEYKPSERAKRGR